MPVQPIVVAVPFIVSAVLLVALAIRWSQRPAVPKRRGGGFNCCEYCSTELPRHPEQAWRYDGTCRRCGRVQTWASPTGTDVPAKATAPAPAEI
jgi:hypothetical protein